MQDLSIELTPIQLAVVQQIVGGATIAKAARRSGVHRSTIYTWLKTSPPFAAALDRYRGIVADAFEDRLRELAVEAFDALEECLNGMESTPATRFRAAAFILGRKNFQPNETRRNPTPANFSATSAAALPCDTLKATTYEVSGNVDSGGDPSLRDSGVLPELYRERGADLSPQMLRVSRVGTADERPSS